MPCTLRTYSGIQDWPPIEQQLRQRQDSTRAVEDSVREIIDRVKQSGDAALLDYTQRFDCPQFEARQLKVSEALLERAVSEVPDEDLFLIEEAIRRISRFHEHQKPSSWMEPSEEGVMLGQLIRPVERAGLYIPGGSSGETPLVSSLIMNAVPALVAGVQHIVAVSPPRRDGSLNPYTLATAALLGIRDVFAMGSAWAVAALALGTETVPAADVIAGPGNIFVTAAKKMLHGQVGIDLLAGPSEITILADDSTPPGWLAADLLSQAEHDTEAAAILVSSDASLLDKTQTALREQLESLPRKEIAAESLRKWGAFIQVPDQETGLELVNRIAPEHLEVCLHDPWSCLGRIRHAGAVFLGSHSPEAVGDYFSGPNHVLPTGGTARFASGLGVYHFTKRTSLISASRDYMQRHGDKIARLARLEGLEAHARSAEKRSQH